MDAARHAHLDQFKLQFHTCRISLLYTWTIYIYVAPGASDLNFLVFDNTTRQQTRQQDKRATAVEGNPKAPFSLTVIVLFINSCHFALFLQCPVRIQ